MSRKAREQAMAQATSAPWSTPRVWFASANYSMPKLSALFGSAARAAVVVLHLPEEEEPHPLLSLAPAAQSVMLSRGSATPAIVVMDLSPLLAGASATAALDEEGRVAALGHQLGKPASRALCKLLGSGMNDVTLLARGGTAQLALKLLAATHDERALHAINRIVFVHPRLPASCVNALLGRGGDRFASLGNPALDLIFDSRAAAERRLPALRPIFADGITHVATGSVDALLAHALQLDASAATRADEPVRLGPLVPYDSSALDDQGRTLWLCELGFAISPRTKQHEVFVQDASRAHVDAASSQADAARSSAAASAAPRIAACPSPAAAMHAPPTAGGGAAAQPTSGGVSAVAHAAPAGTAEVGALVLRGSRCVLARSLSDPPAWRGMRIPSVLPRDGESAHDAAVRAASEFCDIDGETEVVHLPAVPPAVIYRPGGGRVWVYALYAARPPPPGPLEDQDQTDDEDLYDWFTWPRAIRALADDLPSLCALRCMACALDAAAAAAALPSKWGGVFGQEFTRRLPNADAPPAPAPPVRVDPPLRQVESLLGGMTLQELLQCSASVAAAAAERFGSGAAATVRQADARTAAEVRGDVTAAMENEDEEEAEGQEEEEGAPRYRALRPFHPARLAELLDQLRTRREGVRLDGLAWLVTQPRLQALITSSDDGKCTVGPGDPWWAVIPRSDWPEGLADEIAPLWHEPNGDRQTELAIRSTDGARLPPAVLSSVTARLDACLLSASEAELPLADLDDPFTDEWRPVLEAAAESERKAKIESDVRRAFSRPTACGNELCQRIRCGPDCPPPARSDECVRSVANTRR